MLHQAVWQDKLLHIIYQRSFNTQIEIDIEPLGLVAKMNTWYLVGKVVGYIKVIKVNDINVLRFLEQ
jgi:predicted DNA-binding transcriptional regulator YafY